LVTVNPGDAADIVVGIHGNGGTGIAGETDSISDGTDGGDSTLTINAGRPLGAGGGKAGTAVHFEPPFNYADGSGGLGGFASDFIGLPLLRQAGASGGVSISFEPGGDQGLVGSGGFGGFVDLPFTGLTNVNGSDGVDGLMVILMSP
jgi:hypothetical protein